MGFTFLGTKNITIITDYVKKWLKVQPFDIQFFVKKLVFLCEKIGELIVRTRLASISKSSSFNVHYHETTSWESVIIINDLVYVTKLDQDILVFDKPNLFCFCICLIMLASAKTNLNEIMFEFIFSLEEDDFDKNHYFCKIFVSLTIVAVIK